MIQPLGTLFILSFKSSGDDPTRDSVDKYYMSLVKITNFNVLIDNKLFFDRPVKSKQEAYKKLIEMSRNDDYRRGKLVDCLYHEKYCELIGTDLSKQTNTSIPQQINFVEKLQKDDGATMFFIDETQQKAILNFSSDSLIVTE